MCPLLLVDVDVDVNGGQQVGGEQLEAAIESLNNYGRIIACGMVSQYNLPADEKYGVKNLMSIVGKRLRIRGFIVRLSLPLHIPCSPSFLHLPKRSYLTLTDGESILGHGPRHGP